MNPTALIADDEPLLRAALARALHNAWPELAVVAQAANGDEALALALQHQPSVCFLDVRMPGLSGLQAATALADAWEGPAAFPLIVFVTAFDEYALAAFDAQASDYVLKPATPERLTRCVQRLQGRLAQAAPPPTDTALLQLAQRFDALAAQLAAPAPHSGQPLQVLQASQGNTLHLVPVADVLVIEATDRYLRIITRQAEHLLRMPLHELRAQLPAAEFWQIHRSTLVRASAMRQLLRDDLGRLRLQVTGLTETWGVGRLYATRFKAM